ncbi:MAG: hypothetical protein LDL31_07720, partial [Prosthecobacter sp.]|nr:hypothetical protein [Prosthecobacter sp.]
MSHQPRRTSITLTLLVIMPVALLAWLGTYLIRDAARTTDNAREAVLKERLFVADHQLVHDLRQFTDDLDALGAEHARDAEKASQALAQHPWVLEVWQVDAEGRSTPRVEKARFQPDKDALAPVRGATIRQHLQMAGQNLGQGTAGHMQPFHLISGQAAELSSQPRKAVWQTAVKRPAYHL